MRRGQIIVVLGLALLLPACGSRVKNWPPGSLSSTDSYVAAPSAGPADTPAAASAGDTSTTVASGVIGTPSTGAKATTPTTANGSATGLPAPAPGRYTYDEVTHYPADDEDPAETDSDNYTVEWRVTRGPSSVTADAVEADDSDASSSYVEHYRVTATEFDLLGTTDAEDDGTTNCAYPTPQRILTLPLKVGGAWHTDVACPDDTSSDRTVDDVSVIGTATDVIGGRSVATFVVKTTETYTEIDPTDPDPEDAYTEHSVFTTHYDPTTLLVVSEDRSDTDEDGTVTSHRVLRSVTPS